MKERPNLNELAKEIWVPIYGYERSYMVSNMGRVKSIYRIVARENNYNLTIREKILAPRYNKKGYTRVVLSNRGIGKHVSIHRLVMDNFIGCEPDKQVDHINGIRDDNRLSNLRWVTPFENAQNPTTRSRIKNRPYSHNSKMVLKLSIEGAIICKYNSVNEAAIDVGITPSSISTCLTGRTNTSAGFKWKYFG